MKYTPADIKTAVDIDRERLFASYATGRPENWSCDIRTKDFVCINNWMNEQLETMQLDDLGRRTQMNQFNRYSRGDDDLWELAAQIMNDAIAGNIDRYRRTHRRWG